MEHRPERERAFHVAPTSLDVEELLVGRGEIGGCEAVVGGPQESLAVTLGLALDRLERLTLDLVRWERCKVDVTGALTLDDCLTRCREELPATVGSGADAYAVRVEFLGATKASGALRSQSEQLVNEVRALTLALGGPETWIEKVTAVSPPPSGRLSLEGDGVAGQIGRALQEEPLGLWGAKALRWIARRRLRLGDLAKNISSEVIEEDSCSDRCGQAAG